MEYQIFTAFTEGDLIEEVESFEEGVKLLAEYAKTDGIGDGDAYTIQDRFGNDLLAWWNDNGFETMENIMNKRKAELEQARKDIITLVLKKSRKGWSDPIKEGKADQFMKDYEKLDELALEYSALVSLLKDTKEYVFNIPGKIGPTKRKKR